MSDKLNIFQYVQSSYYCIGHMRPWWQSIKHTQKTFASPFRNTADQKKLARSLVVSDLRSETKGSQFESGC